MGLVGDHRSARSPIGSGRVAPAASAARQYRRQRSLDHIHTRAHSDVHTVTEWTDATLSERYRGWADFSRLKYPPHAANKDGAPVSDPGAPCPRTPATLAQRTGVGTDANGACQTGLTVLA